MPSPDVHPLLGDTRLRTPIDVASVAYGSKASSEWKVRRACRDYGRLWLSRMCRTGVEPTAPTSAQAKNGLTTEHVLALNERYREVMLAELPARIDDAMHLAARFSLPVSQGTWTPPTPKSPKGDKAKAFDVNTQAPDPSTW